MAIEFTGNIAMAVTGGRTGTGVRALLGVTAFLACAGVATAPASAAEITRLDLGDHYRAYFGLPAGDEDGSHAKADGAAQFEGGTTLDAGVFSTSPLFGGFRLDGASAPVPKLGGGNLSRPRGSNAAAPGNPLSIGGNFTQSFGAIDVEASAGYTWDEADATPGINAGEDPEQLAFGVRLGVAGLTVGGSFAMENGDRAQEGQAWTAGVAYRTGAWTVGAMWFQTEVEGTPSGSAEIRDNATVGLSYALSPGISASAQALYSNWEEEAGVENTGYAGVVGLQIRY